MSCRLPITWSYLDGDAQIQKAGFLTFPSNTVSEDPSGPGTSLFYNRAYSKWLPVWREAVSPDGRRYAYVEGDVSIPNAAGKVHVVDLQTGVNRVIYAGRPVFRVTDFAAEGIYLSQAFFEGNPTGLWLLDPAGGTPRLINKSITAPKVGAGVAWGLDFNAADPKPHPGGMLGPMNSVLRYDLATGVVKPFFYRPGTNLYLMGLDRDGSLFVYLDRANPSSTEIWRLPDGGPPTRVLNNPGSRTPTALAAIDAHGVWFYGNDYGASGYSETLWLYSNGAFKLVTTVPFLTFSIAGGCIP
jgi:hypothetical protein